MALQLGALRDATRTSSIDARLAGIEARLTMLTWVITLHAAVTLGILGSTFALWSRMGDISGQIAGVHSQLTELDHQR